MATKQYLFTSESVSEGHPDKVADQLSDAVLDAFLKSDPAARVACETLVKNDVVILAGEITSKEVVNYEISRTTRTEVLEGGRVKRLSVAVLVDDSLSMQLPASPDGPTRAQLAARLAGLLDGVVGGRA